MEGTLLMTWTEGEQPPQTKANMTLVLFNTWLGMCKSVNIDAS